MDTVKKFRKGLVAIYALVAIILVFIIEYILIIRWNINHI